MQSVLSYLIFFCNLKSLLVFDGGLILYTNVCAKEKEEKKLANTVIVHFS